MRRITIKLIVAVISFFLGVASFVGWFYLLYPTQVNVRDYPLPKDKPYQDGKAWAEFDISKGKLKIKTTEMPVEWLYDDLKDHLLKKYGIELDEDYGDGVSDEFIERVRGYNDRSRAEIEKRFGEGILERVLHQVEAERERKRKKR
jgi:hypothetical protein